MATAQSAPTWRPVIHRSAQRELIDAPSDTAAEIRSKAKEAASMQKPSNHPDVKLLRHTGGLQRIRAGDYRALCDRRPPYFRVLLVRRREDVYDYVQEAQARQRE